MKKRIKNKIAKKGTENIKHLGKQIKEVRKKYFQMEESRNQWLAKEWIATKRAIKAERQCKKLKKLLLDNGINIE